MSDAINIIDYLQSAMNAENLRRKAIANNIANLETPGYRSKGVKFEELLEKVIEGKAQLQQAKPELIQLNDTPLKNNGNDVSLDMEIGKMVENDLRHSTLVQLLKKKYQQVELAAKIQ